MPSLKLLAAEKLLRYGICTSVYRHPLMLPCQYTFCLQYIVKSCRYYSAYPNGFNIDLLRENYPNSLACAVCMQMVTFPRGVITKLPMISKRPLTKKTFKFKYQISSFGK